jgi:hypothetical protein
MVLQPGPTPTLMSPAAKSSDVPVTGISAKLGSQLPRGAVASNRQDGAAGRGTPAPASRAEDGMPSGMEHTREDLRSLSIGLWSYVSRTRGLLWCRYAGLQDLITAIMSPMESHDEPHNNGDGLCPLVSTTRPRRCTTTRCTGPVQDTVNLQPLRQPSRRGPGRGTGTRWHD